jgi:hypothetical protein
MRIIHTNAIEYILRVPLFLTFFGHGKLALKSKQHWVVYLQTVGLSYENGIKIMPFIGVLDVLVAIIILLKPYKSVVLWSVFLGFATALIRPLSGEDVWSFIERGVNWGAPLALYFLLTIKLKNKLSITKN